MPMDAQERFTLNLSAAEEDDVAFEQHAEFLQQEHALLAGMQQALADIEDQLREMSALAEAADADNLDDAARGALSARFETCKAEIDAISQRADEFGNRYLEGGLDGVRRTVETLQKYLKQNFLEKSPHLS